MSKLYSGAIAIALSAVALAALIVTDIVDRSESLWVFLALFCVSLFSIWLRVRLKVKPISSNKT